MEKAASGSIARIAAIAAVIVIMSATSWRAFGGPSSLFAVLLAAAAALIAIEFRNIQPKLRKTALMLFATSIALLPFARSPLEAVQRGVFVSGLLISLMASVMLLAQCALRSHQVHAVGTNLRGQRPGRRYLSFTMASQLFSAMLGMAGANIMLVMAAPPDEAKSVTRTATVVAVTRGFTAAGFWSPVFGNMAILLALYPTLHWIEVFPLGLVLAQLAIAVGILMNHFGRNRVQETAADYSSQPGLARSALPVLGAMLSFLAVVLSVSGSLKISITASIVLLGPLVALLLNIAMAGRGRRLADGLRGMGEGVRQLPRLSSEAILFTAAGCAGSIMADAFPAAWVQQIGQALNGLPFFGISFLMIGIMGASLLGIHPVLSSVFMASTITPQVLALPQIVHFAAILTGWGLSASVTPFSVLSLTASRYAGTGLYQISIGRNWAFALVSSFLAGVFLTATALLMR